MKLDFENYDSELLENLVFEIRLNNYVIAIFRNVDDLLEYIETFPKFKSKEFRWFFYDNQKIVLDFYEEED